jgi:hypothetical protein
MRPISKAKSGRPLAGAALLLAAAAMGAQAAPPASQLGKWRFNAAESDQGKNPNPTVDGALVVTKDDGAALQFTLVETLKSGAKVEYTWSGAYDGKLRPGSDTYSVGYEHAPGGWRDSWEMTGGPAKGMKGFDDCMLSADGNKQTCRGGLAGSPPAYTLVYEKIAAE